jgi:hypothetical protein
MFAYPTAEEICKTCARPFCEHDGYPNWPSKPSPICLGFAKNIPRIVIKDENAKCAQCGRTAKDHLVFTHNFIGGDNPETLYIGDISAMRK